MDAAFAKIAEHQRSLEQNLSQVIAEVVTMGTNLKAEVISQNIVTLSKPRDGEAIEVQVIVKCGTAHEVRDDLWDALVNCEAFEHAPTRVANAAMERLGFPAPDGGWPK